MNVQMSIEIKEPPEKVWPFMIEPEKVLEWYIPLKKFEYTGEKQKEVGAPFYFEEKTTGGTIKLNCKVTEVVENVSSVYYLGIAVRIEVSN